VIGGKNKVIFSTLAALLMLYATAAHASGAYASLYKYKASVDKDYFLILLGFRFLLPEVVNLAFNDNNTFSLASDLYDVSARGTYDKNILLIKGSGSTETFYDVDFKEEVKIDYTLVCLPIGFRGFYMMGIGQRDYTFISDGFNITEGFIFQGPGL